MKRIVVEDQYQEFLSNIKLKEEDMHPQQKSQLRMTFFAGFTNLLFLMLHDISALEEDEAIKVFDDLKEQVEIFAKSVSKR